MNFLKRGNSRKRGSLTCLLHQMKREIPLVTWYLWTTKPLEAASGCSYFFCTTVGLLLMDTLHCLLKAFIWYSAISFSWQLNIQTSTMIINCVSGGSPQNATSAYSRHSHSHIEQCFQLLMPYTVEPHYNEVLGTMKITLLYQVSHYIRVKKQRNIKSWDQQN